MNMAAASHAQNQAIALFRQGRPEQAEQICRRILADAFPALHLLGLIRVQQRRENEAAELIGAALQLNLGDPGALVNYGLALRGLGKLEEALAAYDQAIAFNSGDIVALLNRGSVLHALGRYNAALESYDQILRIVPDHAIAWTNQGLALHALGRLGDALAAYNRALAIHPGESQALGNKAVTLVALNRLAEALECCDQTLALSPGNVLVLNARAATLEGLRRFADVLESYDAALALAPDFLAALNGRGNALRGLGRLEEALRSYDKALEYQPDYALAIYNRGNVFLDMGCLGAAFDSFARVAEISPDYAEAQWNKAVCHLLRGEFAQGWQLYEWRKRLAEPIEARFYPQPLWTGRESLRGRTLFLYSDQGLGDTIHFYRYALMARALGARVVLSAQDSLRQLLTDADHGIELIAAQSLPREFDYHAPLMSMPLALGTHMNNIPAAVPYLRADPARMGEWAKKIGGGGFKVGIAWQGRPHYSVDEDRSFALRCFEPLSRVEGVRLISLQKGEGCEQLAELPTGMKVETPGPGFDTGPNAFLDTAAIMQHLDLVITSDTSIAHLAGALARPTWVALKYLPEWRWLLNRPDSPWYPTLRLFRQKSPRDWNSVFQAMRVALEARSAANPLHTSLSPSGG